MCGNCVLYCEQVATPETQVQCFFLICDLHLQRIYNFFFFLFYYLINSLKLLNLCFILFSLSCFHSEPNLFNLVSLSHLVITTATATSTSVAPQVIPPRKRGRPKTKVDDAQPKLKLLDKLKAATENQAASRPAVYASTTKGGVKLVYEGHLFKFSFRKAEFSVFQCCFREHGEECKVRVVCDQKNVFPFDGEHVHFMQASDKSVTSSQFMPGEGIVKPAEPKPEAKVEILIQKSSTNDENADEEEEGEVFEIHEIEEAELSEAAADGGTVENSTPKPAQNEEVDPTDFRERIKRRLQKALQNKKK
ncbi:modifier of mdg4 [Drosophila navojoa]|uniref:modifier of mdg4 n=1 Tax=Drosophila navojoa TaxID=7232 RepID=UPI0011BFC297|nr:modifier of mdg4 [Drosophila navojoa]